MTEGGKVREREEIWPAAKGLGLDSKPGRCEKESALMVRAEPSELPGRRHFSLDVVFFTCVCFPLAVKDITDV